MQIILLQKQKAAFAEKNEKLEQFIKYLRMETQQNFICNPTSHPNMLSTNYIEMFSAHTMNGMLCLLCAFYNDLEKETFLYLIL